MKLTSLYTPALKDTWSGRGDTPPELRFFQTVACLNLDNEALPQGENSAWALLGFCSDEGVLRNLGRPGANEGPTALRQQLAKLPNHSARPLLDLGDIHCLEGELDVAQQSLGRLLSIAHIKDYRSLVFGGGHEVAWAHYLGLHEAYRDKRLGIINFDAHFDLRKLNDPMKANSGTPFYQIAQDRQAHGSPFDYYCIGIQQTANTADLFETAESLAVAYMSAEDIHQNSMAWQIALLEDFLSQQEHIYLSICLDVFAESHAPGVSAPQALGLTPWQALPLLKYIVQSGKVIAIDVAELSPVLDKSSKTARLAANIVAELLNEDGRADG